MLVYYQDMENNKTTYTVTYSYFGTIKTMGPFATREQALKARDIVMIQTLASESYRIDENVVRPDGVGYMENTLKTFKNTSWKTRDYECTNIVACQAPAAPKGTWVECDESVITGMTALWREGDVRYFGWL